ncbi:MAG: type II toxin-antitoxin system RelE/ParE family toxin [Desulfurococcales archaeon]|nr:type II toxin-antitoxin system RelE/ParE family toxin [Desulfurococcales archaeon]
MEALDKLSINPIPIRSYDIKKLKGFNDTFRIRIGDVRVVYTVDWSSKTIIVHYIGPRERAYK